MGNTYIQHRRRLYGPRPFVPPPVVVPPSSGVFQDVTSALYDFTNPTYRSDGLGFNRFGAHEQLPHGTPTGYDWYNGARAFLQGIPTGSGAGTQPWFEIFKSLSLSPTYDARVQMKDFNQQNMNSSHVWSTVLSTGVIASNGGYWNGAFGAQPGVGFISSFASYGGIRDETANGGGTSFTLSPLGSVSNCDAVHAWANSGRIPITGALATFYSLKLRLIHDVSPATSLASANFYVTLGNDVYGGDGSVFQGGPGQTRLKKIGYKGDPASQFDGWTPVSVFLLTPLGGTDVGIGTTPTNDQLSDGMRTMLVAHPPTFQSYP